jgi:EAL domain-containing protein (putative c-di-GMP-specific phosphodiesterase class I)/GGDEF domain-containing protein
MPKTEAADSIEHLEQQIRLLQEQTILLSKQLQDQKQKSTILENKLFIHGKSGLPNHHRLDEDLQVFVDEATRLAGGVPEFEPAGDGAEGFNRNAARITVAIIRLDDKFDMALKTLKASVTEWILYQVGMRAGECVQPDEALYHTKDDEFVAVLRNYTNLPHLKSRLNVLYDTIAKPHIFSGNHIYVGCNIGVATLNHTDQSKSSLLHAADIALGAAIRARRPWMFYEDSMRFGHVEKMDLQSGIIRALESQALSDDSSQFTLHYQPQVSLVTGPNGQSRIDRIDAEVLIRWNHPSRGLVPPDKFIPLAEETGLILPIGNWVLFKTIEQLEKWQGTPLEKVILSINISPKQFANEQLMDNLVEMMNKRPSLKHRLKVEITETSLMENPERSIARMRHLNKLGLRFALDDFGKGYSSLNYLTELPLNTIKLDRAFICNVHQSPTDQAIVRAVVYLSKTMKLKLICEGVENTAQLTTLQSQGCRIFQGYYFSKALTVENFEDFVRKVTEQPMVSAVVQA